MSVSENMNALPMPYWIPKKHKSPIGTGFIIASKQSVVKVLSGNITGVIKLYESVRKYRNKRCYSGVNSFWVIQNNKPVIDTLCKLNNQKVTKSISTYDFSAWITNVA